VNGKKQLEFRFFSERIRSIWYGIKNRCLNENSVGYKYYGGRNIDLCRTWKNNFGAFHSWALAHGYQNHLTIDRIDNDGPYGPRNCRWATCREQNRHRRNNVMIQGKCIGEWAEIFCLPYSTVYYHFRREDGLKVIGRFAETQLYNTKEFDFSL
jgi:hypothetical protein